jgi:monofunctional biosynthetic peptidoglycan transglycosylase
MGTINSAARLTHFRNPAPNPAKFAAMVPNPRYYDTHREARGLLRKTGIILGSMNDTEIP